MGCGVGMRVAGVFERGTADVLRGGWFSAVHDACAERSRSVRSIEGGYGVVVAW